VLPVSAPRENSKLNIQVFDNDFFSYDDYISGCVLNLARLIREVYSLDVPIKFDRDYWNGLSENERKDVGIEFKDEDKFWVNLTRQGEVMYFILFFKYFYF
jgi:hypothetical protein